jgi:6-phosphogluconolactonase
MMDYTVSYNVFSNKEELSVYFANLFRKRNKELLSNKSIINIALSGGTTPKLYLNKLTEPEFIQNIDWSRIHFFWADERMVPPADPGSNYGTIKEILFNKIPIPEENLHRIKGEIVPQLEVQRYGNEIVNNVGKNRNNLPEFDWILLGMGNDGHTASIFPHVELKENYHNITAVSKNPETGQIRITITESIINNADYVTFIITGKDKAETVFEILKGNKEKYPAGKINPVNGILEFLIDKEAASMLIENGNL